MGKKFIGARAERKAAERDDVVLVKDGGVKMARFDVCAVKLDP